MILLGKCENFLDEISSRQPLSGDCLAHLTACSDCRKLAETIREFRNEASSAYPPSEMVALKKSVMDKLPYSQPSPSTPGNSDGPAPVASGTPVALAFLMVIGITTGTALYLGRDVASHSPATVQQPMEKETEKKSQATVASASVPLTNASETKKNVSNLQGE